MPAPDRSLQKLILYVVDQLNQMGRAPSTIQLVKYLYLIDLEYARIYRRTLSGYGWIYYKYGPYAFEIADTARRVGFYLVEEEFETGEKRGRYYRVDQEARFPNELGSIVKDITDRVLHIWGLASTAEILDHVYFETEPMEDAIYGELLDFSKAKRPIGLFEITFRDSPRLRDLKLRISPSAWKTGRTRVRLTSPPDEDFVENLRSLELD